VKDSHGNASLTALTKRLILLFLSRVAVYFMFVPLMAFFAKVSDPAIGGTYMTLLNTVCNFGKFFVCVVHLTDFGRPVHLCIVSYVKQFSSAKTVATVIKLDILLHGFGKLCSILCYGEWCFFFC
jgi:hypothetical protein